MTNAVLRTVVGLRSLLSGGAICFVAFGWLLVLEGFGEEKKEPPVIKAISPLGIVDGMMVQLSIRGSRLGEITSLKFPELKSAPVYKIKSKGPAARIDRVSSDKIGDTQVDVELLLPLDTPPGNTTLIVVGTNGESEPRKFMVLDWRKAVSEREPNDGFSEAQQITLGQTIVGCVTGSASRDVYSFSGESGKRVTVQVQAVQLGSVLDPFILIHNADGQLLMELGDGPGGRDPLLELTLPNAGRYFISVRDSKDSTSPMHAYLIRTRVQ